MSDIRVQVQWKNSTVFAGEEIECEITFRNISQSSNIHRTSSPSSLLRNAALGRERWKESLPSQSAQNALGHSHNTPRSLAKTSHPSVGAHRTTLSLNVQTGTKHGPGTIHQASASSEVGVDNQKHKRSVSIVSIGGDTGTANENYKIGHSQVPNRPGRGHARAPSLQVLPRRTGVDSGPLSSPLNGRISTAALPLIRASSSFAEQAFNFNVASAVGSQPSGQMAVHGSRTQRKVSEPMFSSFRFPQASKPITEGSRYESASAITSTIYPRPIDSTNGAESLNPITRILSPSSMNGTPRSSVELYTMSNNSTETLASEYVSQDQIRLSQSGSHGRQLSLLGPRSNGKAAETLMMGYGQITGSFTLDGSLVSHAHFEEVKRKGIIGTQGGGGVVRAETVKRNGGIFGGIGWNSIGESLGGLLGSNELSSIKETKDVAGTRSIPILSTPQSVLFVNLQLGPGECRSYTYRHRLPSGIPPTHKGRAMKVSYNLTIGIQRLVKSTTKHHVRTVDIPFKVLTGVNDQGEILGHDLMSPYIFLHNDASVLSTSNPEKTYMPIVKTAVEPNSSSSIEDFFSYVEATLDQSPRNADPDLLLPTENIRTPITPASEIPNTVKDAIELALLRSNSTTSSKRSPNRFEITRSGDRVAVIVLARPAYRLGEAISAAIDFQDSEVSCYFLHATLESSEVIDPAIALRSKASIHRVTRRIHAAHSECTMFARRAAFNPIIPVNATPDFKTSGVSLEWTLRFGFFTSRARRDADSPVVDSDNLLEEVAKDERGTVIAAVQGMVCEIFDVTVPLCVYGATSGFEEKSEASIFPI